MKTIAICLLLAFQLTLGVSCKKDSFVPLTHQLHIQEELTPPSHLKGEARHTDSLVRVGVLRVGAPNFITRHPGDDTTYDLYYGTIDNNIQKPTRDYIKGNKWTITYKYDNYEKGGCSNIFLWHNGKSIHLGTTPKELYYSNAQWKQIDGITTLEWLEKYPM